MITNRGVKVWPNGMPETFCTDHWRCRFMAEGNLASKTILLDLLANVENSGLDFIKTENLCTFDGQPGYSLGQGQ
jgi:isocitrate dehydrogenase